MSTLTLTVELQKSIVSRPILGVDVAVSNYDEVVEQSLRWAQDHQSRARLFANVHVVMEAVDNPEFRLGLNGAGPAFTDGMPIVWALHALGESDAQQVCGHDATVAMLAAAEEARVSVGFYGGSQETLDALVDAVRLQHPKLKIAFTESPPFRPLTPAEDSAVVERIAASGARLLFVGLGCPKQEHWIVEHLGRVNAVMFAVGAAFDFIAGSKQRAPRWMTRHGLEWAYRFALEPRRLAKRYLKQNPRFVVRFLWQLLTQPA
jgi:N-acetylglucosaminyldiphosphoundecaprenol N-acetyl-beta-D-mannosaminyltransferase